MDLEVKTRVSGWTKDNYWLACAVVFLLLAIRFLIPDLHGNESVKLLWGRRLIDPDFLRHDWLIGAGLVDARVSVVFSGFIAPLWLWLKDAVSVALLGRVLTWILLLYSLSAFSRQLEIKWYSFAIGLGFWIYCGQSLAAGEWIGGGFEQKPIAYAFLFLSLASMLRDQVVRAGIFCGAAVSLHPLVGGWATVALLGALLTSPGKIGIRRVFAFLTATLIAALPMIVVAGHYLLFDFGRDMPASQQSDADSLLVLLRLPHHLDPYFFLTVKKSLAVVVYSAVTFFALFEVVPKTKLRLVASFLGSTLALFVVGIVARLSGAVWFLKYYPFRLADVLILLLFWLVTLELLARQAGRLKTFTRPRDVRGVVSGLLTLLIVAIAAYKAPLAARAFRRHAVFTYHSWKGYLEGVETPFQEMSRWIRDHTETTSTVIAPPCASPFWMSAERAMVVSFKLSPHDAGILEWHSRLKALNRNREFQSVGFGMCGELDQNLAALSVEELSSIRERYSADYYVTVRRRTDLDPGLVHQNSVYYVYDLRRSPQ